MVQRSLSRAAEQVLHALAGASDAVENVHVDQVAAMVGGSTDVAEVVLVELEAVGHASKVRPRYYRVRLAPVDVDPDRFKFAIEWDFHEAGQTSRGLPARQWSESRSIRSVLMLQAAYEHGWYDLTWQYAEALSGLVSLEGDPQRSLNILQVGLEALRRLHDVKAAVFRARIAVALGTADFDVSGVQDCTYRI